MCVDLERLTIYKVLIKFQNIYLSFFRKFVCYWNVNWILNFMFVYELKQTRIPHPTFLVCSLELFDFIRRKVGIIDLREDLFGRSKINIWMSRNSWMKLVGLLEKYFSNINLNLFIDENEARMIFEIFRIWILNSVIDELKKIFFSGVWSLNDDRCVWAGRNINILIRWSHMCEIVLWWCHFVRLINSRWISSSISSISVVKTINGVGNWRFAFS